MRRQASAKEKIKPTMFGFRTEGNSRERRRSSMFPAPLSGLTPCFRLPSAYRVPLRRRAA
jgi:hypothetical protein